MATRRTGKGTTFKFDGTTIGAITDISGPSLTKEQIDVTNFDSPNSYREFIGGLRDSGDLTLTIHYAPSSSADLKLRENFELDDNDNKACELDLAGSGTALLFSGSVASLGHTIALENAITQDVTIRISGQCIVSGAAWS